MYSSGNTWGSPAPAWEPSGSSSSSSSVDSSGSPLWDPVDAGGDDDSDGDVYSYGDVRYSDYEDDDYSKW